MKISCLAMASDVNIYMVCPEVLALEGPVRDRVWFCAPVSEHMMKQEG